MLKLNKIYEIECTKELILSYKYSYDSYAVMLRGSYTSRGNNVALGVVNIT